MRSSVKAKETGEGVSPVRGDLPVLPPAQPDTVSTLWIHRAGNSGRSCCCTAEPRAGSTSTSATIHVPCPYTAIGDSSISTSRAKTCAFCRRRRQCQRLPSAASITAFHQPIEDGFALDRLLPLGDDTRRREDKGPIEQRHTQMQVDLALRGDRPLQSRCGFRCTRAGNDQRAEIIFRRDTR